MDAFDTPRSAADGTVVRRGGSRAAAVPPPSIVRYEEPVLLQSRAGADVKRANARVNTHGADNRTVELLDKMLPPTEYRDEHGDVFLLYPSRAPATRIDAIETQEALDAAFIERQARTTGVCSVREELYSQTFDEVIRQVALRLPERGLGLLRVRDHLRMTLAAYRTLYNSSADFGASKAVAASEGVAERNAGAASLTAEVERLRAQKLELERVCNAAEAAANEERSRRLAKQQQEREAIIYQNTQLQTFVAHAEVSAPKAPAKVEGKSDSEEDDE